MAPIEVYWDTCVFTAFLNNEIAAYGNYISHIEQYLEEAKAGKFKIYCSTITLAEITRGSMRNSSFGTFEEFLEDYSAAIIQITPDPNIMSLAGALRSLQYTKDNGKRKLLTPDAIHLASAIYLKDEFKVPLAALHTFDDGKSKGPEGKSIPILSAETWCGAIANDPTAKRLINLIRSKPEHPTPRLPL
ncbi:PIN domain-containing protein [Methylobacterium sp. J-088]|uniref:type II toxin-antitoxin system VapC family toxin n=1 Tax=Methylobacterium sp. J-088 TaxID=2836664 RepID=UPI001FBA996A|nr:PIN domain-containing protein [Methylobacterium sp. J-088]MCJ2063506.1 PIN domain-containing protein [Methylobacterium sp. J-088]